MELVGLLSILGGGEWEEKERGAKQIKMSEWGGEMGISITIHCNYTKLYTVTILLLIRLLLLF